MPIWLTREALIKSARAVSERFFGRARQIAAEAEAFQEDLPEKPVTMAIEEVADGELSATVKEEYMK